MSHRLKGYKVNVPINSARFSSGTWTFFTNSGVPYISKTAAVTASRLSLPITIPSVDGEHGVKLKSVEIPIRVATADLDSAPIVTIYRRNMLAVAGATADLTASAITATTTGATVTSDAQDRLLTVTVDSPALDYTTEDKATYSIDLYINPDSGSLVRVYDAIAYFEVTV